MQAASGYYLNLYEETGEDLYIIFNEPNDEPTPAELSALQDIVEEQIQKSDSIEELQKVIEETNFDCVRYGFQVFSSHSKSNILLREGRFLRKA